MTEGGSAGDDQIGPTGREPPSAPGSSFRHLPRKGGEGELSISLLRGRRGPDPIAKSSAGALVSPGEIAATERDNDEVSHGACRPMGSLIQGF